MGTNDDDLRGLHAEHERGDDHDDGDDVLYIDDIFDAGDDLSTLCAKFVDHINHECVTYVDDVLTGDTAAIYYPDEFVRGCALYLRGFAAARTISLAAGDPVEP